MMMKCDSGMPEVNSMNALWNFACASSLSSLVGACALMTWMVCLWKLTEVDWMRWKGEVVLTMLMWSAFRIMVSNPPRPRMGCVECPVYSSVSTSAGRRVRVSWMVKMSYCIECSRLHRLVMRPVALRPVLSLTDPRQEPHGGVFGERCGEGLGFAALDTWPQANGAVCGCAGAADGVRAVTNVNADACGRVDADAKWRKV
eukprot:3794962-Amphidinium_carterae.1